MLQCPDAVFMLFNELIAFDHLQNEIILFSNVQVDEEINLEEAYADALKSIDIMGEDLHTDIDYQTPIKQKKSDLQSNFTQKELLLLISLFEKYTDDEIYSILTNTIQPHQKFIKLFDKF